MNKFYCNKSEVMEHMEDGRLVDVITKRYYRADQFDAVIDRFEECTDVSATLTERKASLQRTLDHKEEYLQYADGGAYYQEKDRIRDLKEEIAKIERYLGE